MSVSSCILLSSCVSVTGGASHENQFLGTKAQISSLKLPLKTPAEGFYYF